MKIAYLIALALSGISTVLVLARSFYREVIKGDFSPDNSLLGIITQIGDCPAIMGAVLFVVAMLDIFLFRSL